MAKAFLHGSGASPLNFRVVGGSTQPADPKENTLWVTTDRDISGYAFSPGEPEGKNLLPNTATAKTINGVTYTVNQDGTVTMTGTSTGESVGFRIGTITLEPGTYILSGGYTGGFPQLWLYVNETRVGTFMEKEVTFSVSERSTCRVAIYQHGSKSYDITVKPMIRRSSIADGTYVPYLTGLENVVWIVTGLSSTAQVNALKKNSIRLCPVSAKQCISGAWVDKPVQIYQGGAWHSFADPNLLFHYGDECTDVTGGYTVTGTLYTKTVNADGSWTLTHTSGDGYVFLYTTNAIDLTDRNILYFLGSIAGNGQAQVGVWSAKPTSENVAAGFTAVKTDGAYGVDISALSGKYYAGLRMYSYGNVITLKKLWLE